MKRLALFACLALFSYSTQVQAKYCRCETETFDAYIGAGYRNDDFKMGDSERTLFFADTVRKEYTSIEMVPFFIEAQYKHPCNFYATVFVSYAKTYSGNFKQEGFDTFADTFTLSERIVGISSQQEAFDASGGLGWQFYFVEDFFSFIPILGYANYQQNFWANRFEIELGSIVDFDPCAASQNLHAYWRGPWLGFHSTSGPYWCNWFLNFGYDYTWIFYSDQTNEILDLLPDTDFEFDLATTIKNRAHGSGNHVWLGVEYRCEPKWSVGVYSDWRWFNARRGTSSFKSTFPIFPYEVCGKGTFDGANWNSWSIYITLGYHWF